MKVPFRRVALKRMALMKVVQKSRHPKRSSSNALNQRDFTILLFNSNLFLPIFQTLFFVTDAPGTNVIKNLSLS
jgi:hypothetical protein